MYNCFTTKKGFILLNVIMKTENPFVLPTIIIHNKIGNCNIKIIKNII